MQQKIYTQRVDVQKLWPLLLNEKRAVEHPLDLLLPLHKLYYHSRCFFANWVCHSQRPPQTHWRIKAKKINSIWTMCKAIWESVQVGESGGIFVRISRVMSVLYRLLDVLVSMCAFLTCWGLLGMYGSMVDTWNMIS